MENLINVRAPRPAFSLSTRGLGTFPFQIALSGLNPAPQLPRRFACSTPAVAFHERPVRAPLLYLADSNVRRFSDCALHDKTRDMAGVECYPVPPNSQKKR